MAVQKSVSGARTSVSGERENTFIGVPDAELKGVIRVTTPAYCPLLSLSRSRSLYLHQLRPHHELRADRPIILIRPARFRVDPGNPAANSGVVWLRVNGAD